MRAGLAVVTGASAGLGREFAAQLAARGHDVLLVARDGARLETLAAELAARHGVAARAWPADLSRDDAVDALVAHLATAPVAVLVNNAGFGVEGRIGHGDPGAQDRMVRVHVLASMRLAQAVVPGMLARRRGGIVNVSSVASFVYTAGHVNYCATKAYLTVFSEGLAAELRGTGVRVQALCPGFTHTEFHARMRADAGEVPRWMWLRADRVVRDSLRALDRGTVVCVPSLRYKVLAALIRVMPRSVFRLRRRK